MPLPFSLFLALKYLKPKRTFLSVATLISVIGVLLGVAVLIIVISVMSGFDDMWREKILSFNAHVTITGFGVIEAEDDLLERIRGVEGVTGAAPFVQGLVFLQLRDKVFTPLLRGIDPEQERDVSRIPECIKVGEFSVADDGIVIGRDLALQLGAAVGDQVLIYSPQSFTTADELRLPEELYVRGIFEVGMYDIDMGYILSDLENARDLYGMDHGVHAIQVMTEDPFVATRIAEKIKEELDPTYDVQTWMQMNRQLFAALRVEKNLMYFILIVIVVVASFGIASTLTTTTYQKTREIGLLKSLGFSSGSVMRVFFWQGFVEGLMGIILGIGAGFLVLRYRNDLLQFLSDQFNLELLPKEFYQLAEIPSSTSVTDILIISISALIICTLAGLLPALRAASLDPVKALRYE